MFVNGVRVGCKREGSGLPLVVDVTDQLKKDSDNELVICARNAIAISLVEGWRGMICHCGMTGARGESPPRPR